MAEVSIHCPHCNAELTSDDQYLGMEVECPLCHELFAVTGRTDTASTAVPPVVDNTEAGQQTEPGKNALKISEGLAEKRKKLGILAREASEGLAEKGKKLGSLAREASEGLAEKGKILGGFVQNAGNEVAEELKRQTLTFDEALASLAISSEDPFAEKRLRLARYFLKAETAGEVSNILSAFFEKFTAIFEWIASLFAKPDSSIMALFATIQRYDIDQLTAQDVLALYGKNTSQLVADSHTLFAPAINYVSDGEGPEFKFAISEIGNSFLYSLEEVIKIYTFEDQLLVFKAYWDYTTGKLFNESTEAFFFRDITDLSSQSSYEYMKVTTQKKIPFPKKTVHILGLVGAAFWFFILVATLIFHDAHTATAIVMAALVIIFGLWGFITILIAIDHARRQNRHCKKLIKKSETFSISAKSGNSISMTILCDEWIEAKNGVPQTRSENEKIIHAIRKMIEEKKKNSNE